MTGRIIRPADHECQLPGRTGHGCVWECDCGLRWKYRRSGIPAYERWQVTLPSFLGLRLLNRRRRLRSTGDTTSEAE